MKANPLLHLPFSKRERPIKGLSFASSSLLKEKKGPFSYEPFQNGGASRSLSCTRPAPCSTIVLSLCGIREAPDGY